MLKLTQKLIILISLTLLSFETFAAQFALVVSDKAVIYADAAMTAPIGYLRKGKRLKVGEVPRNQGRVLPVVINKKIAYVLIDDLTLSYDPARLELLAQKKLRKDNIDKQYQFSLHYLSSSGLMTTSETIGGDKEKRMNFSGFGIKGHLGSTLKKEQFRVGMDYMTGSDGDDEYFRIFTISPELFYGFFSSEKFILGALGALYFSPYAQYELSPLFKVNGQGYGFAAGLGAYWNLNLKYKIEFNYLMQNMNYSGYNLPDGISVDSISPVISSNVITVGFNFSY